MLTTLNATLILLIIVTIIFILDEYTITLRIRKLSPEERKKLLEEYKKKGKKEEK
jgi:hypothetical protein